MYMKSCNDTGDSFLMSEPNVEFLRGCVSQALKTDDKDSEQLSPFVSQGKNTTKINIDNKTTTECVLEFLNSVLFQ